jgi:hypothetical protein
MSRWLDDGMMSKSMARNCDILEAGIHFTVDELRRNGDISPTFQLPTLRNPRHSHGSSGKYHDRYPPGTSNRHDKAPTQVPRRERYTPSSQTRDTSFSQESSQYETRDDFSTSSYTPTPPASRPDRPDRRRREAETHFQGSAASSDYAGAFPQYHETPSFAHTPSYTGMPPPGQDIILYQDPARGRSPSRCFGRLHRSHRA